MRPFVALACLSLVTCKGVASKQELSSQADKVGYILGYQMGRSLKDQGVTVAPDRVIQGLRYASVGTKSLLTDDEMRSVMMALQADIQAKNQVKDSAAAVANKKEGDAFLAENRTKPGVKTTASGLQYKVIKEGAGPRPTAASTVTVHYRGTHLNGDEFDNSYQRNEPATFPLNGVIPGWSEGVQLMNSGAKYQFFIPANLAYGERGSPPAIGPNQTLIFEVELLSFK